MGGAGDGMGHFLQQAAAARALAGQRLVQARNPAAGDAEAVHALDQHVARLGADQLGQQRQQRRAVLGALDIGRELRVRQDVGALHDIAAKALELLVVAHRNDQRAVGGLEHAVRHDGRVRIAVACRVAAQLHRVQPVVARDRQAAVIQRHLDQPALARALAPEQRRQHGLGGIHAGHQIDHGHAELERWLLRFPIQRHQPGLALDHQVVAGALGLGARSVVARNGAVDQAGLERLELLIAQAQLLGAAGLEVVQHHIALRQQVVDDLQAFGALQIHGDGPLVAVHRAVVGGLGLADANAPVARVIAALGVLDLDHLGAEIGQHHAAHRARKHPRQIEHAHAFQGEVGGVVCGWVGVVVAHLVSLPRLYPRAWRSWV